MANPRDDVNPQTGAAGANAILNGEFYMNDRDGRTHVRLPAGGAGGGVTSYADVPATEEQHVAFLKSQVDLKDAEHKALVDQHTKADGELKKHQAKQAEEDKKQEAADKKAEEDKKQEAADKKAGVDSKPDVSNPITAETYGRPPQNPPGLESQTGPRNPADGRPLVDTQTMASPVKEPAPFSNTISQPTPATPARP